ncbi:hypothetical protein [Nitrincola iocasae]|uniref:Uncharacterized protein n=1 Tax=Nitrincola iocasae TaxID=2614693 RepID=A0A5J6LGA9_9GAMM|nr:hypothetical protein [Nitrincola iocasae]QEW07396.1 hypothetical protein F5I99_13345 [Nitrincola iocasae]
MNDLLIGALIALISVYSGHRLSISMVVRRGSALESGLYAEFSILNNYLKGWLLKLYDEYNNPLRDKYSRLMPFDLDYFNNIVVELIAVNKSLTKDQRSFIVNVRNRMDTIKQKDVDRASVIERNIDELKFFVNKNDTAYLIADVAETIYYLDKFCEEKRNFSIVRSDMNFDHIKYGLEKSGVIMSEKVCVDLLRYAKG